tara:strand:- start:4157 stop:5638 length:1482 start_codon:yes stop_codon:yes gene_type:complete
MARDEDYGDMFSRISKQRQLNREHVRKRIAQATGGTAATLRGESAPEAFARRAPDYSSQVMTPAQKRDARLKLLAHEEQTEQFYYDKAQRRYLKELAEEMQNRRAILKAEEAKMRESGAAARARATNKRLELGNRINEDVARGKELVTPSRRLVRNLQEVGSVEDIPSTEKRERAYMADYNKKTKAQKEEFLSRQNLTEEQLKAAIKNRAQEDYKEAYEVERQNVTQAARSLILAGAQPGDGTAQNDLVNGIPVLAKKANMSTEEFLELVDTELPRSSSVYNKLRTKQQVEQDEILRGIEQKQIERARASARTYGSSGGVGEAQKNLTAPAQARMAQAQPIPAPTPQAPGGAPQAPGGTEVGVEEEVQQPGFMGIAGEVMPVSAQERTLKMFDIVENFPEHPPAQQAKMQIMASPEFKKYAAKFGPNAPENMVWKEAVRDTRLKAKVGKMEFKKKRAEKRLAEMSRPLRKEKKPPAPVTGSDKGLGDSDVDTA